MTDVLSRNLPAPKNWQDFERLTFDLFRRIWNSDDIELNGRSGQSQSGVDVYGTDNSNGLSGQRFIGIQCKGRDSDYGKNVTEKELRDEVKKALSFQPPLDVFILATTSANDASILGTARAITEEHRAIGKFNVQVKGWDTLRQLITDYPQLLIKYFSDYAPIDVIGHIDQIRVDQNLGFGQSIQILQQQTRLLTDLRDASGGVDALALAVMEIANQITDGSPRLALKTLERLRLEHEASASKLAKFRILANIGNAHMALGAETDAVVAFEAAYAAYPDYANARATLALAKILQGNRSEGLALAREVFTDDPTSRRAAGIIIETMPPGAPMHDIEASLSPDVLGHFEINLALSIRAHQGSDSTNALHYAEQALRLQPDNWRTLSAVAEALLSPFASHNLVSITGLLDERLETALDRSIDLNRQAWKILADQESSFLGRHVPANLVGQLLLVGEEAEASEILDQAIARHPDYAPLLQRCAHRAAGKAEWEAARADIAKIPAGQRMFEDAMLMMQTALQLEDGPSAQGAIPELNALAELPEQTEFAAALCAQAEILNGADPESTIEGVLLNLPHSLIVRSVILEFVNDNDRLCHRILQEISTLSAAETLTVRQRILAAEAFMDAGDYSKAADLYQPLHQRRDSTALYRRLQALHWSDRRREARQLYESLPANVRHKPRYLRLGIAIYEKVGLLKPAVRLVEESLSDGDRLGDRLLWLQLLVRLEDQRYVDWLRDVRADIDGLPRELAMLSQFVDRFVADTPKALELGYRALRAGYGDAQVHLSYAVSLFLQGAGRRGLIAAPQRVEAGAGVILREETTGEILSYVIEPRANPATERGELGPEHSVSSSLIGLNVDDTITIGSMEITQSDYRIIEIQNGYVFAFQRTLRDFNRLFPGHPALGKFTIDDTKEPTERFEPIFAHARRRAEQTRNLEEMYDNGVMPLFLLARFSGVNVLDIWEWFSRRPDKYLKVALGIEQEFDLGRKAATAGIILVDPLTIYSWAQLGLENIVIKLHDRLAVVQSSIDLLRQICAERSDDRGQGTSSFGWDGENYHMIEATPEATEKHIASARAAADLAAKLVLVPAEAAQTLPAEVAALLANAPAAFADTILAALLEKRALLTDDLGLRTIGQQCGIPCTWTQTLLQSEVGRQNTTPDDYRDALAALIGAHYDFTQIGHQEILAELIKSGWTITDRLRRFASLMARSNVDRESLSTLLAQLVFDSQSIQWGSVALAAFHIAFVDALNQAESSPEAFGIYNRVMEKLKIICLKALTKKELKLRLLNSSGMNTTTTILAEFDQKAFRVAKATLERLFAGGLRLRTASS
ncbi:MAG: hypothetical protein P4M05_36350 [Bradyrhizobium sp.]|nr:hypothetical protein [Bradyrhizobium sp.]